LLVVSASAVRFLLGILQLFVNPNDAIQRSIVNFEYLRGKHKKSEAEALNLAFSENDIFFENFSEKISPLFSEAENEQLAKIRSHSLFDMIEQIIALFDVGNWHNEAVFVQTFQDIVLKFSVGKTADLNSFLKWWAKNGEKQCVPSPENQQAFRIMTIHKSKGLDFPVVVMPFCDWDLDSRMRNILWCKPTEKPFDEFPLLPIEYSSKLSQSIFAENYFDEQMHQYIDNLNVAYVAFTRAKNELICFSPASQIEINELVKTNSLSALLNLSFQLNQQSENSISLDTYYNNEEKIFALGEKTQNTFTKKTNEQSEKVSHYPTASSANRLKIRHQSLEFRLENQPLTDSPLKYGTIMHKILQKINQKSDQETVVQEFVQNGFISEAESHIINNELENFWKMPEVSDWFSDDCKILNEATILTPQGNLYRLDRVILKDNTATIIDYKFGENESKTHLAQVRRYMDLISEMGFSVKGFVCYISLTKIVEVE